MAGRDRLGLHGQSYRRFRRDPHGWTRRPSDARSRQSPVSVGSRSEVTNGANVHRPQAHPQVLREDPRSRGDAEPHRGSEGVLRPVPDGRRAARAGGRTRACRPSSSRCSRSRISPTRRCSNSSNTTFEPPKYDVDECRQRGMTFAAPLKVTLRLIVFDVDPDTGASRSRTSRSRTSTWATCRS